MPEWIDFGAPAACGAHRFRLEIPQASRAAVTLYEDMGFAGDGSRPEGALLRARVKRSCWSAVSELVMREFNERLQAGKQLPGRWRTGGVWLERMLGRELCVLCWALEHAASRAEALRMANAWQGSARRSGCGCSAERLVSRPWRTTVSAAGAGRWR